MMKPEQGRENNIKSNKYQNEPLLSLPPIEKKNGEKESQNKLDLNLLREINNAVRTR